ncbi:MAG: ECF-type sigma factor [Candidatus Eisenbacteria bacterium]
MRDVKSADPKVRTRALEHIVESYWKVVYKYLRIRWKESDDEARDLTQSFFANALERDLFEHYDPARARFRTYLRTCLDGFVSNERKARSRLKRGGAVHVESLDFETAEGELRTLDLPAEVDLDQFFLQEWIRSFFQLAVAELRDRLAGDGKHVHLALFDGYDLAEPGERPTYQDLGRRHDIPVTQVTNYLALARRRFREIVLERLRSITGSEEEFRDEARALLGIDPGPGPSS